MSCPLVEQLRAELRAQGYSRSYIARLCAELEDHAESIAAEHTAGEGCGSGLDFAAQFARLGSAQQIAAAVGELPELTPWSVRQPCLAFVVLPGILVCFVCLVSLLGARWASQSLNAVQFAAAASCLPWLTTGCIGIASLALSGWAVHRRLPLVLPVLSACILMLAGLFRVDLAYCAQSGSAIFRGSWGTNLWTLGIPWIACAVSWTSRGIPWWRSTPRPDLGIHVGAILLAIGVAATFFVVVGRFRQSTRPHPLDNIIRNLNQPHALADIQLRVLKATDVRQVLGLTPEQLELIEPVLVAFSAATTARLAERTAAEGPPRPLSTAESADLVAAAWSSLLPVLSAEQRGHLERLAYRELGVELLFRIEVQETLQLSLRQLAELKNDRLAQVRCQNRRRSAAKSAPPSAQTELDAQITQIQQQMLGRLTQEQRIGLEALRGGPFE